MRLPRSECSRSVPLAHGPDARGQREIPRLAGQLYWYSVIAHPVGSGAANAATGGRQDISWIMRTPTVANSTPKQVQALAEICQRAQVKSWRSVGDINRAEFKSRKTLDHEALPKTKMAALAISVATTDRLVADDLPVRNCTWCHGTSAQGWLSKVCPDWPARVADYLINQLQAFTTYKRLMSSFLDQVYVERHRASRSIDPDKPSVVKLHIFLRFHPEAAMDGDSELVGQGKIIFEDGVPGREHCRLPGMPWP